MECVGGWSVSLARVQSEWGKGDNDNLTLLAPELFRIHAHTGVRLEGDKCNILQEVWCSLRDDVQEESVVKAARRTRAEAQSRAQSGLRVMGYSCSVVRSMFPKTEN
jgi:hypothetical protein